MSNHHLSRLLFILLACMACAFAHARPLGVVDFTPHGTQPGLDQIISGSNSCFSCHAGFSPEQESFMPHNTWKGSMMANAGRDPLFWAALDVANNDLPGVGDYCLKCHSPQGWLGGRVSKTGDVQGTRVAGENGCLLNGTLTQDDDKNNDFSGLGCHFCHRMMPEGPAGETTTLHNGDVWIDDADSCETPQGTQFGPCRRGPYGVKHYAPFTSVEMPPHAWVESAFHRSSDICGSCHNVTTPMTDSGPARTLWADDGGGWKDTGIPMPIERTYSEWKLSTYADRIHLDGFVSTDVPATTPALKAGQTCQDCHMPESQSPEAQACYFGPAGGRTGTLSIHEFAGANTWVPGILKGEYGAALDREAAFDATVIAARRLLTEQSAVVETSLLPFNPGTDSALQAQVKVTNLSGHKLPTGYAEGRRMWLNVVARDGKGAIIFESGAYDAVSATLTEDAQLKVYEIIQGQWDPGTQTCVYLDSQGRKQFHFVLNNCVVKDNRIPPLGFRGGDSLETRNVAYSYPETSPGSGVRVNHDLTSYSIPVAPGTTLPISVEATLRFQIASRDYVEFLRREAQDNSFPSENAMCSRQWTDGPADASRGEFLFGLWEDPAYGKSPPEVMVGDSAVTPVEIEK